MTTERAVVCLAGALEEIPDALELGVGSGIVTLGSDQDLAITPAGTGRVLIQKALLANGSVTLGDGPSDTLTINGAGIVYTGDTDHTTTTTASAADTVGCALGFTSGAGGPASATGGGVGGAYTAAAGTGGAASASFAGGVGGRITVQGGAGGAGNGSKLGGVGGDLLAQAGTGGVATASINGATGGSGTVQGGTGGAGTATKFSGAGGGMLVRGGAAGKNNGGGAAVGGDLELDGGAGSTNGRVLLGNSTTSLVRVDSPFYIVREFSAGRTTTNSSYTDQGWESYIGVTDTSNTWTITLAKAGDGLGVSNVGRYLAIKDESGAASGKTIEIAADGFETIDGSNKYHITTNYGFVTLMSDNSGAWWIISKG